MTFLKPEQLTNVKKNKTDLAYVVTKEVYTANQNASHTQAVVQCTNKHTGCCIIAMKQNKLSRTDFLN